MVNFADYSQQEWIFLYKLLFLCEISWTEFLFDSVYFVAKYKNFAAFDFFFLTRWENTKKAVI